MNQRKLPTSWDREVCEMTDHLARVESQDITRSNGRACVLRSESSRAAARPLTALRCVTA